MSILIKGINLPEEGYMDIRIYADGFAASKTTEHPFHEEHPVTEIPSPHGRLLDENDLLAIPVNSPEYWGVKKLVQDTEAKVEKDEI